MYLNFIIKNYYYIRLLILFEQKYQSFSLNYNENLHDLYQNVIYLSNYNLIDIEVQSSLGNIINNNYNQIYQIYSNFLQDLSIELNKMESLNMFLNEIPQNQIKDLNQKIKNLQMFEKDIDPTKFEEIELDLEKKSIDFMNYIEIVLN